jgi:hypothetical protein
MLLGCSTVVQIRNADLESVHHMKHNRTISFGLAYLLCFLTFSSASAQTLPNGTYAKTSFGAIEISCVSSEFCFAAYEGGHSFMYLTSPDHSQNFTGYWAEEDASQICPETQKFPNISTNAWGNVNIFFDLSAESWTGFWGYCEEHPNREFDGERDQGSTQQVDADDGFQSLAEALIGSWMPAQDLGANRNDIYTFNPDNTFVISDGSSNSPPGTWLLENAQLFMDGRPVPLTFLGQDIELAGTRFVEEKTLTVKNTTFREFLGMFAHRASLLPVGQMMVPPPKVGDYALHFVILGSADSFRPGASQDASVPVHVEFWNETEEIKMVEGGAYRDDIVVFDATEYEVGPERLTFHGYHPEWGDLYFSAQFDGNRVFPQTQSELGGGAPLENADLPLIVGDMLVKGHIFRDVELYLAFLH